MKSHDKTMLRLVELSRDLAAASERLLEVHAAFVSALGDVIPQTKAGRFATVLSMVADRYSVDPSLLLSSKRDGPLVTPRFVVYWLCSECLGMSYSQIGRLMSRNHASVSHGCRVLKGWMDTCPPLAGAVQECTDRLKIVNNSPISSAGKKTPAG